MIKQKINEYINYCEYQKNLSAKTIKSYKIDLNQFINYFKDKNEDISKDDILCFITMLRKEFKPKSVKRKIASVKAFYNYLEDTEYLEFNPFNKIKFKSNEPFILPKTIPANLIENILKFAYKSIDSADSEYAVKTSIRNTAVLELLFATGIRVSELCSLKKDDINFERKTVKIYGKGSKERIIYLGSEAVIKALKNYKEQFENDINSSGFFFVNRLKQRLSEQSVRQMIDKYCKQVDPSIHVTPHMFRHSFATLLLEEGVDIRYIQQLLGHSSITTTQIYTHVTSNKQRDILINKHPRNKMNL